MCKKSEANILYLLHMGLLRNSQLCLEDILIFAVLLEWLSIGHWTQLGLCLDELTL